MQSSKGIFCSLLNYVRYHFMFDDVFETNWLKPNSSFLNRLNGQLKMSF